MGAVEMVDTVLVISTVTSQGSLFKSVLKGQIESRTLIPTNNAFAGNQMACDTNSVSAVEGRSGVGPGRGRF